MEVGRPEGPVTHFVLSLSFLTVSAEYGKAQGVSLLKAKRLSCSSVRSTMGERERCEQVQKSQSVPCLS